MAETQTYATHRRYYPIFHFFVLPLLSLNVLVRIAYAVRHAGARLNWWEVVFALALLIMALAVRSMALRVQDRLITLEESLRLSACLPEDLRGRVSELTASQLIALRFCDDAELPDLTRSVLGGELRGREQIKRRIKNWRPDRLPRA